MKTKPCHFTVRQESRVKLRFIVYHIMSTLLMQQLHFISKLVFQLWAANVNNKIRDFEFEARMLLKSPEAPNFSKLNYFLTAPLNL